MHNYWTLSQRAAAMNPSVLREILKVIERPGMISFAGGLPAPETFPVEAFARASERVLREQGSAALQYAPSEGYGPLREAVAAMLPWQVSPEQVLITTGSQQGLDLVAKVLLDAGSRVLVEEPTYLGALQAFAPMQPQVCGVAADEEGVKLDALHAAVGETQATAAQANYTANHPRFLYVLPNFQNPTGHSMGEARRVALVQAAQNLRLPLLEDNPYGELWFDAPPPAPLASRNPNGVIYLGSFSKVLAPGLRLGYMVAPKAVFPKLLQAKQAADLHTPGFNQRMVAQVLQEDGGNFLSQHVPNIRALYKSRCQAMLNALQCEMTEFVAQGMAWNKPAGGMFLWLRLPPGMDAQNLLPKAIAKNVAFVPGAAFYANQPDVRTMRLSFVTVDEEKIAQGIALLAQAIREAVRETGREVQAK
ncbi:unnamed protein product [Darwinula stevensoni]|uniref:Aminotransferase class I/classII large domain-containing protein n=1 Tax=Darwinula stevensoni TaxID=69355 RepID=A0A7R9AIL0_9CRUS|nr:unnamed protein product [Darwinula stevensoni]CAG0906916.1 unnamed protein product [Darwinula stevensoni]